MGLRSIVALQILLSMAVLGCSDNGTSITPCSNDRDCSAKGLCLEGECREITCSDELDCEGSLICYRGYCARPECGRDLDCPGTQHCQDQMCVDGECREDSDCPPDGYCEDYVCRQETKKPCNSDEDCTDNELCLGGFCEPKPSCTEDRDCPVSTVCEQGLCERRCFVDEECPPANVCRDGHCRQHCLDDSACLEPGTICSNNACVPAQCAVDDDCPGELVRCRNGRCEAYTPCLNDRDCPEEMICLDNICEQLPECTIDEECAGLCQGQPCLCIRGHCHQTSTCAGENDCAADQDCIGGYCHAHCCRGPGDCQGGLTCLGCECVPPGDPGTVAKVVILTQGGPVLPQQQIQLEALAFTQDDRVVPGLDFEWTSLAPERASVDATGLLTGGSQVGDTQVTARVTGTAVVSDPVTFANLGQVGQDELRVCVVDANDRKPVSGATVRLMANMMTDEDITAANGTVTFPAPQSAADIHVFSQGHDYVSILGTTSRDVLVPVSERIETSGIGGTMGQMSFLDEGEASVGLAGISIAGKLTELNSLRLLGDLFIVSVQLGPQVFSYVLPSQFVFTYSAGGVTYSIKETYYALGMPGRRAVWGIGGWVDNMVIFNLAASGSIDKVLTELLPHFASFNYGLAPNFQVNPRPLVPDSDDVDSDGNTGEMRPDWHAFQAVNMTPDRSQDLSVMVQAPLLPRYNNFPIRTTLFMNASLSSMGMTPLGFNAAEAVDGALPEKRMVQTAPFGGLEKGLYAVILLAIPAGGSASEVSADMAMVLHTGSNLPKLVTFGSGFLNFPEQAHYDSTQRRLVSPAIEGASLYSSIIRSGELRWEVYFSGSDLVTYTLPPVPNGMDDLTTSSVVNLVPITLKPGLTFEDLVSLNGDDLDRINLLMTACTLYELQD